MPDSSLFKCLWKRLIFQRKHALCIQLELISSAHNHINSVVLLSVVWRTGLAYCLPPWPTWLFREPSTVSSRSSRIFNQSLRSSSFTDQLIPPAFSPLFPSSPFLSTDANMHTHKGNQIDTPPNFSYLPHLCFPSTSHLLLLFTLLSPSVSSPPPPSPSVAESTGGNSRYMYGWLLCGCHDNHHEFDMALTYPGGCEPGRRASNGAHVPQEWNSGGF